MSALPTRGICFHCGAEIPEGVVIEESRDAGVPENAGGSNSRENLGFCCHGCQGAYLLISGAGLADFYRRR